MRQTIFSAIYQGKITAPASKSYLQRAIAIASLSDAPCVIQHYYPSSDAKAALSIVQDLGAKISIDNTNLTLQKGKISSKNVTINCGEAGLSARMFSPIAAMLYDEVSITGEGSLLLRPMRLIADALQKLGVAVCTNNGFLPIHTKGQLKPADISIDGSESSQLLTGLLIALSQLNRDSVVRVSELKSIPYIEMTLVILKHFGVNIEHKNHEIFWIKGNQNIAAKGYAVEGDWSGAAFHLVGGAISGKIVVDNLNIASAQADKAVLEALKACGATIITDNNSIIVEKNELKAFEFDATHCPDLFPPLAVLAAACEGVTTLIGVDRLLHKESNRALSLQIEMRKVGIMIKIEGNKMRITGGRVGEGLVSSQNDHRIAMAMAILGLISNKKIEISDAEAVNKSYPTFWDDFKMACV